MIKTKTIELNDEDRHLYDRWKKSKAKTKEREALDFYFDDIAYR